MKEITKDNLEAFGMVAPKDGSEIIYPLEKILARELIDNEEQVIALVVTHERNHAEVALKIPGGTLFLIPKSIEDLQVIERCIQSFEPNY